MESNFRNRDELDAVRKEFEQTRVWDAKFWSRFRALGCDPDLAGTVCLDFGSGLGSLSHDIAGRGAASVTGIDISESRVQLSRQLLELHAPEVCGRVRFVVGRPTEHCEPNSLDYVFSRDTFEHVQDLRSALRELCLVLKPGGSIISGFGPLYNSPFGDHGLLAGKPRFSGGTVGVPWGHLAFGDLEDNRLARLRPKASREARDQLNRMPFAAYEEVFEASGMEIETFRVNVSDNPGMKALSWLRRLRPLREYCSVSIYCVLRKPVGPEPER